MANTLLRLDNRDELGNEFDRGDIELSVEYGITPPGTDRRILLLTFTLHVVLLLFMALMEIAQIPGLIDRVLTPRHCGFGICSRSPYLLRAF